MTKLLSGAVATIVGVYILIQSLGLFAGQSDFQKFETALARVNPAKIESVTPIIDAFGALQVDLTRENIDRMVKASLALRQDIGLDLRILSNLKHSKEMGEAIGKLLATQSERIEAAVKAAGFESGEQYLATLGTVVALYPASLVGDSEKTVHEEFAKVPEELDKLKAALPAMADKLVPIRQMIEAYSKFVMAKPGNVKMVLANKGKIETVIGKLDKDMLAKLGTRTLMGGGIN